MSEFKIKPQGVRSTAQDISGIAKQMKNLEDQILRIQNGLSFEIAQKERIRQRLRTARSRTASQYKGLYNSTSALDNIVNAYEATERKLAGVSVPGFERASESAMDRIQDVITVGPGFFAGTKISDLASKALQIIGPGGLVPKLIFETSEIHNYEKDESKTKYGKGSKNLGKDERKEKPFYSKNKENLKESDIKAFKVVDQTWSDTKSAFHKEVSIGDKDGTHVTGKYDVLKREASAELYAGLYYTDPKTGEKKLRMAAGASAGFTISAFTTEMEGQLGTSNLGGYGKVETALGKGELKAEGVVGLRDANGKFNPTAHGKLSAEVIAAEVSGKAGVKIAGTDVGVKGSVNVGFGAHAEFGLKDGKFSMDIGASFGVGASVKLEIDVSGTVNAAKGAVKSAWNGIKSWFK